MEGGGSGPQRRGRSRTNRRFPCVDLAAALGGMSAMLISHRASARLTAPCGDSTPLRAGSFEGARRRRRTTGARCVRPALSRFVRRRRVLARRHGDRHRGKAHGDHDGYDRPCAPRSSARSPQRHQGRRRDEALVSPRLLGRGDRHRAPYAQAEKTRPPTWRGASSERYRLSRNAIATRGAVQLSSAGSRSTRDEPLLGHSMILTNVFIAGRAALRPEACRKAFHWPRRRCPARAGEGSQCRSRGPRRCRRRR